MPLFGQLVFTLVLCFNSLYRHQLFDLIGAVKSELLNSGARNILQQYRNFVLKNVKCKM
jgi:hypothetical protein